MSTLENEIATLPEETTDVYKVIEHYEQIIAEIKAATEIVENRLVKEYEAQIAILKDEITRITGLLKIKDRSNSDLISSYILNQEKLQELLDEANATMELLKQKLETSEKKSDELEKAHQVATEMALAQATEISNLSTSVETLQKEVEKYQESTKSLCSDKVELQAKVTEMNTQISDLTDTKAKLETKLEEEKNNLVVTTEQLKKESQATEKALREEKDKITSDLQSSITKLAELNALLQTITLERDDLKKERDNLQSERDQLKIEWNGLKIEWNGLVSEKNLLTGERDALVQFKDTLSQELEATRKKAEEKEIAQRSLEKTREVLEAEKDVLNAEKAALEAEKVSMSASHDLIAKNLEDALKSAKTEIDALKSTCDSQIKRHAARELSNASKLAATTKALDDTRKQVEILTSRVQALEKEKDEIEKMRYMIEKDFIVFRATIEKELKQAFGIPFSDITPPRPSTPVPAATIAQPSSPQLLPTVSSPPVSPTPAPAIAQASAQNTPVTQEDDDTEEEPSIDASSGTRARKYFSNRKPFTIDFVAEKIKRLRQADFFSPESLAKAFSSDVLVNEDGQFSYICSDIGKKKFKYIDSKGTWKTDKDMSYLRALTFPIIEGVCKAKIEREKSVLDRQPSDENIGKLVRMRENTGKKNKEFNAAFSAALAPMIAYTI